ncbi:MAG: ribosome maturation factor RimP [Candidatus Omnitrophica bacterium]|nr:ribosome maturation factor RimP [Candidatus Omnitrophota bacterium]
MREWALAHFFYSMDIEGLHQTIKSRLEAMGAELVDLAFRRSGSRSVLTVTADKPGGITLEDCAAINQDLGRSLEEAMEGPTLLEVNSPGLDRPLETERDFLRAVGEDLRLTVKDESGAVQSFMGRLAGMENGKLKFERRMPKGPGVQLEIPWDAVVRAVREIRFKR